MLAYVGQACEAAEEQYNHKHIIKGEFFILKEPSRPFKELQNLRSLTDVGSMHRLKAVTSPPRLVLLSAELWFC